MRNRRRALCLWVGIGAGLAVLGAFALAETYPFHHYRSRDGLVQDQAFSIYQDPRGYIWIGTFGGLSRYDGQSFQNFSLKDGLPSASIHAVFQDRLGRTWVGTPNGAARLDGKRFVPHRFRSFKSPPPVYAVQESADGVLWFATRDGLLEWRADRERLYGTRDGLPGTSVMCLVPGLDGWLYAGTTGGLCRIRHGRVEGFPRLNEAEDDEVRDLSLEASTGRLLLTRRNRLTLLQLSGESSDLLPDPTRQTVLWDAAIDRQGTLWATSVDGLFVRFPGREFIRLTTASGLLSNWLYQLLIDYEDNVWLCSNGGVDKLSDRTLTLYTTADGLVDNIIWSVFPVADGFLVGTHQGAQHLGPGGLSRDVLLPGRNIAEVVPLPSGELLVGTDKGIHRCRGTRARPAVDSTALMDLFIYRIEPLTDGSWLLATGDGLYHATLPTARRLTLPAALNRREIYDILARDASTWWLATDRGIHVLRRQTGGWSVDPAPLLPGVETQCFAVGPAGELLAGTIGHGLYRWDGQRFVPMSIELPNRSDNVWAMRFDPHGVLWVGTSRGLVFIRDGHAHDFNAIHGLPFNEITSRSSLHFEPGGDGFFGTTDGLIRYRPGIQPATTPPHLEITGVAIDRKAAPSWAGPVRLKHDESLAISFKCLSFLNEQGNRYQFKLEGVDPDWGELTADSRVLYPFLPPGEITFRLRAFNSRGVPAAVNPALRLQVVPPFTRTVGFYLLVGLGVFAIAGAFVGYKLWVDRREKVKLRALVSAKTAELQASEEKYRELVEGSLIGIAILQGGRFVFVNTQISRTFKYDAGAILGQPVERFVLSDDLPLLIANLAARVGGDAAPHEFEIRALASDGTVKTLLVHTNLTQYGGGPAILLNFIDVSEKKKMQEQLIHYQKLESIGTLAGGIAHDFNNILQGITGYSSLVRMQLPADSPFHRDLGMIEEAAGKAAVLTKKLLGFARKGKYVVTDFNIHEVIESVISLSRRTIPLNIDFVCRLAPHPLPVQADRTQLEQVFLNLFLNSRDAITGSGQIRIETALHETAADQDMGDHVMKQGRYVRVAVTDTGCGIPPDILPRIFDPFFTTKPQGKGTGLGLATVYGIIKNHHGYIYIQSESSRGTTALVYLPLATMVDTTSMPVPARASATAVAPAGVAGRTVLVVDDEATNRRFMTALLNQAGLLVLEAENGQRAVEEFRAAGADVALVILDINMPVMPGQHALEQLLAMRPDVPILVLSGYQEDAIVQEMIRRGARDFVQKPVDSATLLAKVSALLRGGAPTSPI